MQAIQQWLNDPSDYGKGVSLYCVHGDNLSLKQILIQGPSEYNHKRLSAELSQLCLPANRDDKLVEQLVQVVAPAEADTIFVDPQLLEATDRAAKDAWKEMMNLRAVMFRLCRTAGWQDENQPDLVRSRGKLALEILDVNKKRVTPAYEKLYTLKTTGRLQQDTPVLEDHELVPDDHLKHVIDNTRKALSKLRNKEQTPERIELIQKHQRTLNKLLPKWHSLKS